MDDLMVVGQSMKIHKSGPKESGFQEEDSEELDLY